MPDTPPHLIGVRLDGEEIWLDPEECARLIEDGRIPPRALLREGEHWVRVEESKVYGRTRPAPEPRGETWREVAGLRAVLFPPQGLSVTEALLLVNLLVMAALLVLYREEYLSTVRGWTTGWWHDVRDRHLFLWWIPTLFLHANPGHILRNAVSLVGGAGAVEFLLGRRWAAGIYLGAGLAGAWLSYAGHARPPLSIGASGAVFGLYGATAAFLIRNYGRLSFRQRWKARRVYAPILLLLILPSILYADYFAHLGGFAGGLGLGLLAGRGRLLRVTASRE